MWQTLKISRYKVTRGATCMKNANFPLEANIPEYQDVEYFDIQSGEDCPGLMFNRFTLGLMMNAVNSGSEYTKALFLYLHRTYYSYGADCINKGKNTITLRGIGNYGGTKCTTYSIKSKGFLWWWKQ